MTWIIWHSIYIAESSSMFSRAFQTGEILPCLSFLQRTIGFHDVSMFNPYQYHSHNYMVSFNGHLLTKSCSPKKPSWHFLGPRAWMVGLYISRLLCHFSDAKKTKKKNSVAVGSSPKKFVDTWATFKTLIDILVFRLVHKGSLHWLIIIPNWVDLGCIIPHPFSICGAWCGNVSNASRALKALNDPGSFERWTEFVFGWSWNLEAGTPTKINMERKKIAAL